MSATAHGLRLTVAACCLALLGACASHAPSRHDPRSQDGGVVGTAYGTVRDVGPIGIDPNQPQGAGAIVGGVIGGLIGRQMADSHGGRNVGTVIGAVGGAVVGNEVEKNARRDGGGVRITVTLDDGRVRHFDFRESGGLRVGDRVRVEGRQLYRVG